MRKPIEYPTFHLFKEKNHTVSKSSWKVSGFTWVKYTDKYPTCSYDPE